MRIPVACLAVLLASACQPEPSPAAADPTPVPTPADTATDAPSLPDTVSANFRCGDLLAGAVFDNVAGELVLTVSARRLVLPQAMAASGARYADELGNEFWNKGERATLTLDGIRHDCDTTDQVSPWDEARSRGVAFRGLGTEPFWSLEVDAGASPRIRLDLDMGQRPLLVAQATALEEARGYTGTADDSSAVTLRITPAECSDGMSDQRYPASIELTVGDEAFRGCGGFLDP